LVFVARTWMMMMSGEWYRRSVLVLMARARWLMVSGLFQASWSLWPGLADWWWAEMSAVVMVEKDLRWLFPGLGFEVQDLVKEDGGVGRQAPSQCPTVL
jgi:hypothetical protein